MISAEQVEIETKYEGYLRIAEQRLARSRREEGIRIPDQFDYGSIRSLRNEARTKLSGIRPHSLGQAGRIPGITPADIQVLAVFVERARHCVSE